MFASVPRQFPRFLLGTTGTASPVAPKTVPDASQRIAPCPPAKGSADINRVTDIFKKLFPKDKTLRLTKANLLALNSRAKLLALNPRASKDALALSGIALANKMDVEVLEMMISHENQYGLKKAKEAAVIIKELLAMHPNSKASNTEDAQQRFSSEIEVAAAEPDPSGRIGNDKTIKKESAGFQKVLDSAREHLANLNVYHGTLQVLSENRSPKAQWFRTSSSIAKEKKTLGSIELRVKNLTREIQNLQSKQKEWTTLLEDAARKAERVTVIAESKAQSERAVMSMSVNSKPTEAGKGQPVSTVMPATRAISTINAREPKGVAFDRLVPRLKRIPE